MVEPGQEELVHKELTVTVEIWVESVLRALELQLFEDPPTEHVIEPEP